MLRRTFPWRIPPTESYNNFCKLNIVKKDQRQVEALRHVEKVYTDLISFQKSAHSKKPRDVQLRPPNRLGMVPLHILRKQAREQLDRAAGGSNYHPLSHVKGLYLYGGVGCGKTMLMDILFNEAPIEKKQRVHFHQFMIDVHKTMHQQRLHRTKEAQIDPFDEVAQKLVSNAELLCFDEIVVSDVSDAMILKRLFNSFYKIGVCVVFTSNRAPDELYKGGLNRESFMPFIRLITDRCVVHDMQSTTDYRLSGTDAKTYLAPINAENDAKYEKQLLALTGGMPMVERRLRVFGRDVIVPHSCKGVCEFTFAEVCGSEMSTADYSVIAKTFNTMLLKHVPALGGGDSDIKRRFLQLVDTLYQFKVKLVVYAEVAPELLESAAATNLLDDVRHETAGILAATTTEAEFGKIINADEGTFQMQRCISRLMEMRSQTYLEAEHAFEDVSLDTEC